MTFAGPVPARVAVIVPAHDEEDLLGRCLTGLGTAVTELATCHPGVGCDVVVVLDSCTDDSARVAAGFPARVLEADLGSVGAARRAGVAVALAVADAAGVGPAAADPASLRRWHERHLLGEGHDHVHGANLGVRAAAYLAVGGFGTVRVHGGFAERLGPLGPLGPLVGDRAS